MTWIFSRCAKTLYHVYVSSAGGFYGCLLIHYFCLRTSIGSLGAPVSIESKLDKRVYTLVPIFGLAFELGVTRITSLFSSSVTAARLASLWSSGTGSQGMWWFFIYGWRSRFLSISDYAGEPTAPIGTAPLSLPMLELLFHGVFDTIHKQSLPKITTTTLRGGLHSRLSSHIDAWTSLSVARGRYALIYQKCRKMIFWWEESDVHFFRCRFIDHMCGNGLN